MHDDCAAGHLERRAQVVETTEAALGRVAAIGAVSPGAAPPGAAPAPATVALPRLGADGEAKPA